MKISRRGIDLIKRWEGCSLKAYKDIVGVWTIGYGSTGPHVKEGLVITSEAAEQLLLHDLERFEKAINLLVKVPLQQHQFDALCSFVFNVGEGAFKKSTLLKLLNKKDYIGAADQFLRWNKAGGREVLGLTNRRASERNLFRGKA